MYGTISATVRYSVVYCTVHRKWSEMYGNAGGIFPSTRREKDFFIFYYMLKAKKHSYLFHLLYYKSVRESAKKKLAVAPSPIHYLLIID